MNNKTLLYQITETSKFMMSFVVVTKENNAIVIDGGREEDMPPLCQRLVFGAVPTGCMRKMKSPIT